MGKKAIACYAAVSALALLVGCNIFPSGDKDSNNPKSNLLQGQVFYEKGDYADAMDAYQRAILEDSTCSLAYFGYAEASVRLNDITLTSIYNDLDSTNNSNGSGNVAFLNHDRITLTKRLDAAIKVNFILGILDNRDSLTRFFNYLRDTTAKSIHTDSVNDSLYHRHFAFMQNYMVKSDAGVTGYYRRSQFPLTDFAMPMSNVLVDYGVYKLILAVTQAYDLNGDGVIDSSEYALMSKLKVTGGGSGGGGLSNLDSIKGNLNDSATRTGLNNVIQNLSSGLGSAGSIISQFLPSSNSKSDTSNGGSNAGGTGNVDSAITSLGGAITFYQFGDGKDNDGDGCIDEEILDSKDNDGDGFVDEDARITPDSVHYYDNFDNDHNGLKDPVDVNEAPVGSIVNPARPWLLGFVNLADPTGVNFIKIKKGDANINLRIQLQGDSLSLPANLAVLKSSTNSALKTRLQGELDSAKSLIGGCWHNYP